MSNWAYLGGGLPGVAPGQTSQLGTHAVVARDDLDTRRMGIGKIPDAEYPDGYLGTIQSRREDRLLDQIKARTNDRNYQRGVHKGETLPSSDYFWPDNQDPMRGLQRQATTGQRNVPLMTNLEELIAFGDRLPSGARDAVRPRTPVIPPGPVKRSGFAGLAPDWT